MELEKFDFVMSTGGEEGSSCTVQLQIFGGKEKRRQKKSCSKDITDFEDFHIRERE